MKKKFIALVSSLLLSFYKPVARWNYLRLNWKITAKAATTAVGTRNILFPKETDLAWRASKMNNRSCSEKLASGPTIKLIFLCGCHSFWRTERSVLVILFSYTWLSSQNKFRLFLNSFWFIMIVKKAKVSLG